MFTLLKNTEIFNCIFRTVSDEFPQLSAPGDVTDWMDVLVSLTKLVIVSQDLWSSTVTGRIAFDQQDSKTILKFERLMKRFCQAPVSKLETLVAISFTELQ